MKKTSTSPHIWFVLFACISGVSADALAQDTDDSIVIGKKRQIESEILSETRTFWIYTPIEH